MVPVIVFAEFPNPRNNRSRKAVGHAAEAAAREYLQKLGYRLVSQNWRCHSGEIDLIMRDGETFVFAEVRSRTTPSRFGTAAEAITPRKCRQVRKLAEIYLRLTETFGQSIRFDAVAVTFDEGGTVSAIKHVANAF